MLRLEPKLGDEQLAPEWEKWAVDNLLDGVEPSILIQELEKNGISQTKAAEEIFKIFHSPGFAKAKALSRRLGQVDKVLALQKSLREEESSAPLVERQKGVDAENFFRHYFSQNRPVVLTDLMEDWSARSVWNAQYFKEKLGNEMVSVTLGREADPDYDINFKKHSSSIPFSDYIDRVFKADQSNDFYMTANNRIMEKPAFLRLLDDVIIPEAYIDPQKTQGTTSLWLGPGGTITPLHHDNTNILFCQVQGRKKISLVHPSESQMWQWAKKGYYSDVDLECPDQERFPEIKEITVLEVLLQPGEALFIPVGWWHQVRALDLSISLSFTQFWRPNRFDWYHPQTL